MSTEDTGRICCEWARDLRTLAEMAFKSTSEKLSKTILPLLDLCYFRNLAHFILYKKGVEL